MRSFAASKLGSFGKREEGSDDLKVVVRVGPFMLDETPDQWLAAGFLAPLIGTVSVRLGLLAVAGAVAEGAFDQALRDSHSGVAGMCRLIGEKLTRFGLEGEGFGEAFERTPEIIAEVNAEHPDPPEAGRTCD